MVHKIAQSSVDIAVHCAYECEHCVDQCLGNMAECARLCMTVLKFVGPRLPT